MCPFGKIWKSLLPPPLSCHLPGIPHLSYKTETVTHVPVQWIYSHCHLMMGIHSETCVFGNFVVDAIAYHTSRPYSVPMFPMRYFYTMAGSIGLFMPASKQTCEQCLVLQCYNGFYSLDNKNFSANVIYVVCCWWNIIMRHMTI